MSKLQEPRRLELDDAPELKAMIEALRNDAPGRAGMQRMTQNLERSVAALPAGSAARLPLGLPGKIGLVVLASGALVALVARMLGPMTPAQSAQATEPAHPVASGTLAVTAPARGPAALPPPATPAVDTNERERPAPAARASRRRIAQRHSAKQPSFAPETSAVPASEPAGATEDLLAPEPPAQEQLADVRAAQARPVPVSTSPAAEPQAGARPAANAPAITWDEADMLQRARRLAAEQPAQALRLLDEHRRHFAHGMLAPEREVLAIEILRAQSRTAEARARLAAFRSSFPSSVYLERLEHPDSR
jgi:hypothetical protein